MQNVYCEPYSIERGDVFEVHHVNYEKDAPYTCFMHFHEVHEFIIFDDIEGDYFGQQGNSRLQNNDVVFTTALDVHDFEVSPKAKSWHILQVLPEFFNDEDLLTCESFFKQNNHFRLPETYILQLKTQLAWLKESFAQDPHSQKSLTLLKLIILTIADYGVPVRAPSPVDIKSTDKVNKFLPVVNTLRATDGADFSMVEAASMCNMSPSHFSRQFKKVFRCSFSEYLLRHKLHVAARQLSLGKHSITQISYDLNFSSPSHFIAQFKRQFSETPLQYQKALQSRQS
ncbi:AraC family transcriptional regulator [Alteromonas sp. KUL49]|uniref:helix-turn-helix domain-containing protein n=1 Tax=Alteromonas sp. KUL49 TaxID=2480798 RepID=UPI00102EF947|nr:AraC family transcriptional regulator [Alteromonas sp. KUL49]TAP33813.1 AraC family transcriptional regulator [Alteromonas sp. KUL49]GEA13676.1 hypothetical protein KUL49_40510 [Alteromonas sp. KUL49]